jgi:ribose transport system substrate-binding protein
MSFLTPHRGRTKKVLAAIGGLALVIGVSACSTVGGSSEATAGSSPYMVAAKDGPLRIGFSNNFAGNAFKTQLVAEMQYAADQAPDDVSSITITDANNSADTQISQINDLLTKGIDILLVDATSLTALNGAIQRAWQQGVLVVAFDSEVSSEHALIVNTDNTEFGKIGGDWLASQLSSGDEIITLDGTTGIPVSQQRLDGALAALEPAGISVVGSADTDWDQAKGQTAATNLLAAHPDIKGIYSQGGASSLGAINAIQQRGGSLVPITGEGNNGFLKAWKELKDSIGWESIAPSNPPSLAASALAEAIKAIRGMDPGPRVTIPLPVITQETLDSTVRPDMPDSLFLPTSLPDSVLMKLFGN